MKEWKEVQSYTAHKTTHPTVHALAQHVSHPDQVLSGGADGQVLLYDVAESKITRRFTGHTKSVNALLWHPERELVSQQVMTRLFECGLIVELESADDRRETNCVQKPSG